MLIQTLLITYGKSRLDVFKALVSWASLSKSSSDKPFKDMNKQQPKLINLQCTKYSNYVTISYPHWVQNKWQLKVIAFA